MYTIPLIELPSPTGSEFINPEDIISIRADDKSIFLTMVNQKQEKPVKLSMTKAEKLFSHEYLVRCHRSHIINVLKIKERCKKESWIKLANSSIIPISDKYKERLETVLKEFCKKWVGCKSLIFNR